MVGKMILPLLGGTPAVWCTEMFFFQATLLAGYAYTHTVSTRLPLRRQLLLQAGLLIVPFLFLPIAVGTWEPPTESNPVFSLLGLLLFMVGVPFFVAATSAPLLQKWFAATGHPAAKDPYFLYAASNLGSMLALLLYPVLIEPFFGLGTSTSFNLATQSWLWAVGYIGLIILVLGCGGLVFLAPPPVKLAGAGGSAPGGLDRPSSLTAPTVPEENATPAATTTPPGPADQPAPTDITAKAPPPGPAPAPKPGPSTAIKKGSKQQKKHRHQKQQKQQRDQIRSEPQPRSYAQPAAATAQAPTHAPALVRQDE